MRQITDMMWLSCRRPQERERGRSTVPPALIFPPAVSNLVGTLPEDSSNPPRLDGLPVSHFFPPQSILPFSPVHPLRGTEAYKRALYDMNYTTAPSVPPPPPPAMPAGYFAPGMPTDMTAYYDASAMAGYTGRIRCRFGNTFVLCVITRRMNTTTNSTVFVPSAARVSGADAARVLPSPDRVHAGGALLRE